MTNCKPLIPIKIGVVWRFAEDLLRQGQKKNIWSIARFSISLSSERIFVTPLLALYHSELEVETMQVRIMALRIF